MGGANWASLWNLHGVWIPLLNYQYWSYKLTLLPWKIKVWPQVNQTNWPQILERFVEKEKNVAQIKNLSGVRKSIQISQNLTKWSEGYHWNQLVELVILIPNSIFHVKVSCQSTRPIRYGNNDTLTRCKSIITKLAHIWKWFPVLSYPTLPTLTNVVQGPKNIIILWLMHNFENWNGI